MLSESVAQQIMTGPLKPNHVHLGHYDRLIQAGCLQFFVPGRLLKNMASTAKVEQNEARYCNIKAIPASPAFLYNQLTSEFNKKRPL